MSLDGLFGTTTAFVEFRTDVFEEDGVSRDCRRCDLLLRTLQYITEPVPLCEVFPKFGRPESAGPRAADIRDGPSLVDQIVALGPGRITRFDDVVHIVDDRGNRQVELLDHEVGDVLPFLIGLRLLEDDALAFVGAHLPLVFGMSFFDVDDEELGFHLEVFVQLLERSDRFAERRSGVAAEDQDDIPLALEGGELDGFCTID